MLTRRITAAINTVLQHLGKRDLLDLGGVSTLCIEGWKFALKELPRGEFCNGENKFCFTALGEKPGVFKAVSACLAYLLAMLTTCLTVWHKHD